MGTYLKLTRERCSEALHILDRFHIVSNMNKAVDKVRAEETSRMKREGRDRILKKVKKVAKSLLEKLKREKLVLDWRKQQTTRAMVFTTIQEVLDELPRAYTKQIYDQKCDVVHQHVYETYPGAVEERLHGELMSGAKDL